jgi:DNA-binding transcriptional LysR family regulator
LTAAGQILAGHTSHVLETLDRAASEIDELAGLRRGHVRIWTAEGSVNDMVVPAIAAFQCRHPEVTYEVTIAGTDRIVRALLQGDADLAVVFNPPPEPELLTIRTSTVPLMAVGHPQHPAMAEVRLTLPQVASHSIALPDTSFGLRHLIDAAAKISGVAIRPTLVTNSIEALRSFARLNAGLTLLPKTSVAWDLRRHSLKVVPILDKALRKGTTAVLTRKGRVHPVATSGFITHLIATIETLER